MCISLKNHKNLQYLNISNNKIRTEGAMAVADLLFSNNSLRECNKLNYNKFFEIVN